MPGLYRSVVSLTLSLLAACSGYEPEYHCKQLNACACEYCENVDPSCKATCAAPVAECAKLNETAYDALSESKAQDVDDEFDGCEELTSCEFTRCFTWSRQQ